MEARLARSDTIIPLKLKEAFQRAVVSIEQVSAHKTDSKPIKETSPPDATGSTSDKASFVVTLIDPAMYPLVNGRSRVLLDKKIGLDNCLSHIAEGVTAPVTGIPDELCLEFIHIPKLPRCKESQWLPCEVRFPDSQNAKIVSYVDNLHPEDHADVYPLLEKIITKAMPLWNLVYSTMYGVAMRAICESFVRKYAEYLPARSRLTF